MPSKKIPTISAPTPQRSPANFKPLALPSLDFSLTAGTSIPSPPATPPQEEIEKEGNPIARSPTPGGGPLSSHPTTPVAMPGAYPTSPVSTELKANKVLGRNPDDNTNGTAANNSHKPFPREASAAALPISPPNGPAMSSRRSSITGKSSMRRLFSLRSLYSRSNSSSTDCFSGGMSNASTQRLHYDPSQPNGTRMSTSGDSIMAPYRPASSMASARPESRMTDVSSTPGSPGLRKKRSSGFFGSSASRRKSGLFLFGSSRVDENGMIPEDSAMESEKENIEPPPTIDEVVVDTNIGGAELFSSIK